RRRAAPRRTAPGREAPVLALRGFLTGARSLLSFAGCPEGRRSKVPAPRHWSALRTQSDTKISEHLRASGASRRLFYVARRRRSLKTQQRAFTSRPLGPRAVRHEPV